MNRDRVYTVTMPGLCLVSAANAREHWGKKAERAATERSRTAYALCAATCRLPELMAKQCARVLITRIGPRPLDDDNLQGSGKAVRDAVAKVLGVDDDNRERFVCKVAQESGAYAVRVDVLIRTGRIAQKEASVHAL
jgi:hypothetical protein